MGTVYEGLDLARRLGRKVRARQQKRLSKPVFVAKNKVISNTNHWFAFVASGAQNSRLGGRRERNHDLATISQVSWFFNYALSLRSAGMSLKDIEATLRDQATFGRSAHERRVQISEYHANVRTIVQEIGVISVASPVLGMHRKSRH